MKSFDEFYEFLLSEDCFEKCLVSFIDEHQRQRYIEQTDIWAYRGKITDLWMSGDDTIKIEGYEQFKYIENGTIHIFYSPAGGPTFPLHSDPVNVIIEVIDGSKCIETFNGEYHMSPGQNMFLRAGVEHRAINYEKALTYSYGINDTNTLSSIHKDN